MTAQLLSTSEGQTLVLTLSNPEFRNALGPEMYAAGVEALNVAESSADVRSVVITGANGIFSAGGNLQRLKNNRQLPPEHQAQSIEGLHNWIEAIRTFPKPGNTLLVLQDMRISPAIFIADSRDVAVTDVTIHHSGAMGVIGQRSSGITLKRLRVTPRPGSGRLVSTTVDATITSCTPSCSSISI